MSAEVKTSTDGDAPLSAAAYRRLRRATETHREELVVRLAGEVGLKPAEIARVQLRHVLERDHDGVGHYFLRVPDGDGGTAREAYLPADVEHDLRQYARTVGVADDEPLVPVSPRRVQMLVADVGERATDGDDALGDVSTRTLRRHFAHRLLAEESVDPRAVKAVGGWERLASLDPFVDDPDRDDIAAAFADTDLAPARRDRNGSQESQSRFDAAFERVRAVGDVLADAATREGVEGRACETLVDGDAYAFAWVGQYSGDALHAGHQAGAAGTPVDATAGGGAVSAVVSSGRVRTTDDVRADAAFAGWRDAADAAGFRAAAMVPVSDGDTTYGVLGVGLDADAVSERERDLLADLGQRVGRAVTVVQQRQLLLADTVVELALETTSEASFFAAAAAEHDCVFELEGVVPGEDQTLLYFVRLSDAPAETVLSWATDQSAVDDGRLVRDYGDEALLELVVSGADVAKALSDRGASVRELTATPSGQRVVADVTTDTDVRALVADVTDAFPGTELVSKRERSRDDETAAAFRTSLHDSLTDKQATALRAAYHAGYFEWPRGSTAEELADAIGVTSPTLHNHLRRAQQKLLTAFLDDEPGRGDAEWPE